MAAAQRLLDHGIAATIIEAEPQLGGNCFGIDVEVPGQRPMRIDAGVSDFNIDNFVRLRSILDGLGVSYEPICTDAVFATECGAIVHRSDGAGLRGTAEAEQLTDEIARFNETCVEALDDARLRNWTLGRYVAARGLSQRLARNYLYPRAIGAFPMPDVEPSAMPLRPLVQFWRMHGLVGGARPGRRMAVVGGMHRYCDAWQQRLAHDGVTIRCDTRVVGMLRRAGRVELHTVDGRGRIESIHAEHVILATSPQALRSLLDDPSPAETAALSAVPFARARVVVHDDPSALSGDPSQWGAYGYTLGTPRVRPTITFFPKRMRGLAASAPNVLVAVNPSTEPDPRRVIAERWVVHPVAGRRAELAAAAIETLAGRRNTWFAGSWLRAPYLHEQTIVSGEAAADGVLQSLRIAA